MNCTRLPVLFSMIAILMLVVISGCKNDPNMTKYAGYYAGQFTGDYGGTWSAKIKENGSMDVTVMDQMGKLKGKTKINGQGEFKLVLNGPPMGPDFANKPFLTWEGKFVTNEEGRFLEGTWSNLKNCSGTFSGVSDPIIN